MSERYFDGLRWNAQKRTVKFAYKIKERRQQSMKY